MVSILVPIGGSSADQAALHVAVDLARGLGATLTLLAVAPLVETPVPATAVTAYGVAALPPQEREEPARRARDEVDAKAAQLPAGLEVRTCVGPGAPGDAIVQVSAEGAHDLVVLSWHGNGALGHLLHDHTAHHVLDHCDVPVVVVPAFTDLAA
jgi:nucleotide-binding universal stress UspA family protein